MDITIVEIARLAGVSVATVSRVINNPEKVAEETRVNVLKIMEENNYVYNALAGGLANKNTRTLGLIIPTITNPVFALSTNGIQTEAAREKYSVLLGSTEYSATQEYDLIRLFLEKQVDGIVLTGSPLHSLSVDYMRKRNVPFVMTWEKTRDRDMSFVTFDNASAARQVVDYFISMGHRRIGFISGDFESSGRAKRRWKGYRESLKKAKITYDNRIVVQTEFTVAAGRVAAQKLLHLDNPPTAIFCVTDLLAYGAMAAAQDIGKKVGTEISIIGFDDLEMSAAMNPPLTSLRIPAVKMGEMAAKILIDTISGENTGAFKQILETELVIRQSVARL